jgi:hypothetical protein
MRKPKEPEQPPQIHVGEYGPGCRSPQAVEWMKGDGIAYLKPSLHRALDIRAQRKMWETQDKTVKNQAEYNGGMTFDLSENGKPKAE